MAEDDQFGDIRRLDQDKPDGWPDFEFIRDLGGFSMDFDPIVLGFSREDLDGDFLHPLGCKP
jgi:hypothetical protein